LHYSHRNVAEPDELALERACVGFRDGPALCVVHASGTSMPVSADAATLPNRFQQ
jgi:hypothetical protein